MGVFDRNSDIYSVLHAATVATPNFQNTPNYPASPDQGGVSPVVENAPQSRQGGLKHALGQLFSQLAYGGGQAALAYAGLETDAERDRRLVDQRYKQALAQQMLQQIDAATTGNEAVSLPDFMARELNVDPSITIPRKEMPGMLEAYIRARSARKQDPYEAIVMREQFADAFNLSGDTRLKWILEGKLPDNKPDNTRTEFEEWRTANPNAPISDWLALKAKYQREGKVVVNTGEKPPSGVQSAALRYFIRGKQASDDLQAVEDTIASKGLFGTAWLTYAPNWVQSDEGQLYQQAARAFTEARLRKDSGAAIPETEFENDRRMYFARPGDTKEVMEQKRRSRAAALEGIAAEAGRAYEQYFGYPFQPGTFAQINGGESGSEKPSNVPAAVRARMPKRKSGRPSLSSFEGR